MPLTIVKEAEMFGFVKMANLAQFEYIIGWYRSILTLILIGPFSENQPLIHWSGLALRVLAPIASNAVH